MAVASLAALVTVLLALSGIGSSTHCPRGYHRASSDKCFKLVNNLHYCAAHSGCTKSNGRLVEGAEWLRILANVSSAPWKVTGLNSTWIGLTDLLEERGTSKDGWQWTSGERAPASDVPWMAGEPNNDLNDCTMFRRGGGVVVENCHESHTFICEPAVKARRPRQFAAVPVAPIVPNGFAAVACTRALSSKPLPLDCFVHCFRDRFRCEAVFINAQQPKCLILYNNDASVQLGDPRGWRKFKSVG